MKWEGNRESDNVEDRRGSSGSSGGGGGMIGGRGIGVGTVVIALLGGWVLGINPLTILGVLSGGDAPMEQVQQGPAQRPPADDRMAKFVSTVLADTEDVWKEVFAKSGARYQEPRLVLFRGATPHRVWQWSGSHGAVLLPRGPKGVHRPGVLPNAARPPGCPG